MTHRMPVDYRAFWGKARPAAQADVAFHPNAWHGLDVASVFLQLLETWPRETEAIAASFADAAVRSWQPGLAALVALHDVGKFAPAFQAKVPALVPACLGSPQQGLQIDHGAVGLHYVTDGKYLKTLLEPLLSNIEEDDRCFLLQPAFGHHGRPVGTGSPPPGILGGGAGPSAEAARQFAADVLDLFGQPVLPALKRGAGANLSWRLAGLMALADWIGSDVRRFPYVLPQSGMTDYWRETQVKAQEAVAAARLQDTAVSLLDPLAAVTAGAFVPTDGQTWAATVPLDAHAGLFLLEDVMGSGKTEAALVLAHRLLQAGRASGIYVALPTQATANALYRRMAKIYRALFAQDGRPSLILAHGGRDFDDTFTASLGLEEASGDADDSYGAGDDETASATCARWLADDRRKTFLADVGVGTIDQALLAILPVKHCAVRQLGLRRRVLIVDEAHAYDAYMQKEIEALIDHQARMGAPVIVLSATLPGSIKARLVKAWRDARLPRGTPQLPLASKHYPLATAVGYAGVHETALEPRADLVRRLRVLRLPEGPAADHMVIEAARRGAAVARLCNTVDDAIATYLKLRAAGIDADLFHARFAMIDRLRVETAVLQRFGRTSTPADRAGRVLVATQVVEQSLDLDFDLMVSDLAPVDLLLQRAGRIWRHTGRTDRGWNEPTLAIVSDDPVAEPGIDWVARLFPRGQWVYRDHARLWRTAREMFAGTHVHLPGDMRRLVETVYDRRNGGCAGGVACIVDPGGGHRYRQPRPCQPERAEAARRLCAAECRLEQRGADTDPRERAAHGAAAGKGRRWPTGALCGCRRCPRRSPPRMGAVGSLGKQPAHFRARAPGRRHRGAGESPRHPMGTGWGAGSVHAHGQDHRRTTAGRKNHGFSYQAAEVQLRSWIGISRPYMISATPLRFPFQE